MNARIPEPCLCGATDCRACHGAMAVPDEPSDDRTLDALDMMAERISDARSSWMKGKKDDAMWCLRVLKSELDEVVP